MREIHRLEQLEDPLECPAARIEELAFNLKSYVKAIPLSIGGKPPRTVWAPKRELRQVLSRLYRRVLSHRFESGMWSHGGVPGRSIVTNALQHRESKHFLSVDIRSFFPSLRPERIERTLKSIFAIKTKHVQRVLARLTTINFELAQGFPTSSILANASVEIMDRRIAKLARRENLCYTRYVDDVVLSGQKPILNSTQEALKSAIERGGFRLRTGKTKWGNSRAGFDVTGIRIHQGRLTATKQARARIEQAIEAGTWAIGEDRQDLVQQYCRSLAGQLHHLRRIDIRFVRKVVWELHSTESESSRKFKDEFFRFNPKLIHPKRLRKKAAVPQTVVSETGR